MRARHLVPLILTVLAGCTSGGNNDASPPANDLALIVDTGAGTDRELRSRIEGVFLESAPGQLTANLLRQSAVLTLTHPLGSPAALPLASPPRSTYTAIHLLFLPAAHEVMDMDGSLHAVQAPANVRVTLQTPTILGPGGARWLSLAHAGPLQLTQQGSLLRWDPRMTAGTDTHFLRATRALVTAVDRSQLSADVLLTELGDLVALVRFAQAEQLSRSSSDDLLTPQQFVDGLQAGSRLLLTGVLDNDRSITAVTAIDLGNGGDDDDDDDGHGRKSEADGTIVGLLSAEQAIRLQVRKIRKGGDDLPAERPLVLTVRAGDAKIKWVPRHARHRGHLDFDDLTVGMRVEVEWFGQVTDLTVDAHKIDIRGEGPPPTPQVELEGRITQIDSQAERLLLAPAAKDVFELGDEQLQLLAVVVGERSTIIDTRGSTPRSATFADFAVDQRLWVRGARVERDTLKAEIVLILPDR